MKYALLVLSAGCNWLYGLDETKLRPGTGVDLDLDSIPDDFDDCIAPMRDAEDDLDADQLVAANDPCPFDGASAGDTDGDTLHDTCDPFPSTLGDRQRCYMSFSSIALNDRIWKARDTTNQWTSSEGQLSTKTLGVTSGLVSTLELAPAVQSTLDAVVTLTPPADGHTAFRIWGRAAETFDNQELGCELSGDSTGQATGIRVAVVRGNDVDVASTSGLLAFPMFIPVRVRMTLAASGTGMDVRCVFSWSTVEAQVKAHIDEEPPGRVAFGVENAIAQVLALAIYERDTIAPLP